jgi:Protein of unknown function (DUF1861)
VSLFVESSQSLDLGPGEALRFDMGPLAGYDGLDVYNTSAPFPDGDATLMFGRIEERGTEQGSLGGVFAEQPDGAWKLAGYFARGTFQDLFHSGTFYDAQDKPYKVFGGVVAYGDGPGSMSWETALFDYRDSILEMFDSPADMQPFAVSPKGMKGVRPVQLNNGRFGVFDRPQYPDFGGDGMIGYFEVDDLLTELEPALHAHITIKDPATLIAGLFARGKWGGANQPTVTPDDIIEVVSHQAWREYDPEEGMNKRHYQATYFEYDPKYRVASEMIRVASAEMFPQVVDDPLSPSPKPVRKQPDHGSIVYPGGFYNREGSDRTELYAGVGDLTAGKITMNHPRQVLAPNYAL